MKEILKQTILVAIIGLSGVCFYNCAGSRETWRSMKLVDCTNSTLGFHLRVPKGAGFSLALSSQEIERGIVHVKGTPPYAFSGRVRISDASPSVVEFPISSDKSDACNWREGAITRYGYSFTQHLRTNRPGLDRFMSSQGEFDVEIAFDQAPPTSESVWLRWRQALKDRE